MSASIYAHIVLLLSSLASGVFAYLKVPRETPIAIHFDHKFEPDSWVNPFPGLFILPAASVLLTVVYYFIVAHGANQTRDGAASSGSTLMVITVLAHLLMLAAQLYIVNRALGQ